MLRVGVKINSIGKDASDASFQGPLQAPSPTRDTAGWGQGAIFLLLLPLKRSHSLPVPGAGPAAADSVMGVSLFREHAPDDFGVFTLGLYSMFRLTAGETQVRTWLAVRSGSHSLRVPRAQRIGSARPLSRTPSGI